jgi:DNA mismatch endonuclease, patch repair protein
MIKLPSTERRSALMASIPSRDTRPEIFVRRLLHAMGHRFRLHQRQLPGCPDIVLARYKAAIFVHGCFWHQHEGCTYAHLPRSRTDYWWPKLERNRRRDAEAVESLKASKWRVLVVWECETRRPKALYKRVCQFLGTAPCRLALLTGTKLRLRSRKQSYQGSR